MTTAYAFWNNKGGVGKSFLCFVAACEYAYQHPNTDVYILDLCPQANVAGYLEARLNSPFRMIDDITSFLCHPQQFNTHLPPISLLPTTVLYEG